MREILSESCRVFVTGAIMNIVRTEGLTGAGMAKCGAKMDALPPAQRRTLRAGVACSISGLVEMTPASAAIAA